MDISVVIPLYNEEESLPVLHEELDRAIASMGEMGMHAEIMRGADIKLGEMLLKGQAYAP